MWMLLLPLAWAWETDPLTGRDAPPAEALPVLDAHMQGLLRQALEHTNVELRCRATPARTQRVLARHLHEMLAEEVLLEERGFVRGQGYDVWGAWMEREPLLDRISWMPKETIYGDLGPLESPILALAGTCSMYTVTGYFVGSDKFDHFLGEGYAYYLRSRRGRRPERGPRWGTETELHLYGLDTSLTFSFADLAANHDGYTFFAGLLGPDSALGLDDNGCVVEQQPFTWARWVDWRWDEAYNPSVYRRGVERAVHERLEERAGHYCAVYEALGGPEYEARLTTLLLAPDRDAVGNNVPERVDPFELGARCD